MVPSELEAMQVYSPESWKLTGWICKPPDCNSVTLGTWTEPLAKTCNPTERENNKTALRWRKVIESLSTFFNYKHITSVCVCVFVYMCGLVPFLQVMAGFGAPLVWHVNEAVLPSVTVCSDGGNVNVGATPEKQRKHEKKEEREIAAEDRVVGKEEGRGKLNGKENGKRKDDSADLKTSAFSLINEGFIHYLVLRVCA